MSKPLVRRFEVWDKLACESTPAGVGFVDHVRATATQEFEGVTVVERLNVVVPSSTHYLTAIVPGRIMRVLYIDGSFDEYRIAELRDSLHGGRVQVLCDGILLDLAKRDAKVATVSGGRLNFEPDVAPSTVAAGFTAWVLPSAPSYFSNGTFTPTEPAAPGSVTGMPLAVAIAWVQAGNLAAGATYRLRARRNGTTDYLLDVVDVGAAEPTAYLSDGLQLRALERVRSSAQQTNRAYGLGRDGRGIGDNWFVVTAVSANSYLEIEPIDGELTNPIVEDDALNGTHSAYMLDAATEYPITDTDRANRRIYMTTTPASPVGKWVRIALSGGDEVAYLDKPTSQASYGVLVGEVPSAFIGRTNFTANGDASDWTGARPAGWTGGGTAPTKSTAVGTWETGGQSVYYGAVAFATTTAPAASFYAYAGEVITVIARVRVDLQGAHLIQFGGPYGGSETINFDTTWTELGYFVSIVRQYQVTANGAASCAVGIGTGLGSGSTYLDSVMVLRGPADLPPRYVRHSEGALMWLQLARHLEDASDPIAAYTVDAANLTRADGAAYPNAALALGATVVMRAGGLLGVDVSARIVRVEDALHDPYETQVAVASRAQRLTQLLAGGVV